MYTAQHNFVVKGKLAKVWLAAHNSKLKKQDVLKANIEQSVKDILHPAAPLSMRVNGRLLLGVSKLYNKKVKYLNDDCRETHSSVLYGAQKRKTTQEKSVATAETINLPEPSLFELDGLDGGALDGVFAEINEEIHRAAIGDITLDSTSDSESMMRGAQAPYMEDDMRMELGLGDELPGIAGKSIADQLREDEERLSEHEGSEKKSEDGSRISGQEVPEGVDKLDMPDDIMMDEIQVDDKTEDDKSAIPDLVLGDDMQIDIALGLDDASRDGESKEIPDGDEQDDDEEYVAAERAAPRPKKRKRPTIDRVVELTGSFIKAGLSNTKDITYGERPSMFDKRFRAETSEEDLERMFSRPSFVEEDSAKEFFSLYKDAISSRNLPEEDDEPKEDDEDKKKIEKDVEDGKERDDEDEDKKKDDDEMTERRDDMRELPEFPMGDLPLPEIPYQDRPELPLTPQRDDEQPRERDFEAPQLQGLTDIQPTQEGELPYDLFGKESQQQQEKQAQNKSGRTGWSKRTQEVCKWLSKQPKDEFSFDELTAGKGRKIRAGLFHELLVLKTNSFVDIDPQNKAFADISFRKTDKFSSSGFSTPQTD